MTGTHQIIGAKFLHLDRAVKAIMYTIEKDFGPCGVSDSYHARYVHNRATRVQRDWTRDQPGGRREKRFKILYMKCLIFAEPPPSDLRAVRFESEPCRNVRFVIRFSDDDFARLFRLSLMSGLTSHIKEVALHAEGNFARIFRVSATLWRS
jgi:hypothetical protein